MYNFLKKNIRRASDLYWSLRGRLQFALHGQAWSKGLSLRGSIGLTSVGKIKIGEDVKILSDSKFNRAGINHPAQLVAGRGAVLTIGKKVGISGASIYCMDSIDIGDNVQIGANASVYDTDFHSLDYLERRASKGAETAPVVIENDVWLCANVIVLKGVRIGARSVIAANSVVTRDIPSDTLAAGTPAKPISKL